MANLRIRKDEEWAVLTLDQESIYWPTPVEQPIPASGDPAGREAASLVRVRPGGTSEKWILLSSRDEGILVNGSPLALGIKVLDDRDEIRLASDIRVFFSTEEQARVELFPGIDAEALCARCGWPIEPHKHNAVKCPRCSVWVHQMEEIRSPCWLYTPQCPNCEGPTAFDAGLSFDPEDL